MTWSILAKDPESGLFGLAVASRFFAVGALCPWSGGPQGAAMSQALPNPELGARALMLLGQGHRAGVVVEMLAGMDRGIEQRQLHVIDSDGGTSARTGTACVDWCGHLTEDGVSVAGNMLAGPQVIAGDTGGVPGQSGAAHCRAAACRDAGGRGCRRRQARQTGGGAAHPGAGMLSAP